MGRWVWLVGLLAACTIEVKVDKPNVVVDCVIVELPGGQVITQCDGGMPVDAGTESAAPLPVIAQPSLPLIDQPPPPCPNSDPYCRPLPQ